MVREKFLNDKFPIYLSWSYGNLEDDLIKNFEIARILGSDILLGNSASAENNHLDAFALLVKVNLEDRKIISPLCYGDSKYKDLILTEGEIFFGDNFEPLINFMPINEYLKTIEKCGFVIMNHIRQQALGNILIMLYFGAKIFLRKECPTYIFLKEQGAVVFSIQELEKNLDLLQAHIDSDSVKINQKVVMNNWSRDVCKKKTEAMLTLVRSSF